jgi:glycosyltransferase involved in cell wall biosynthesis
MARSSKYTKFSVVVPVYNCGDHISLSLDSLNNQTYSDFELILVDDGSRDDSLNIIYNFPFRKGISVKIVALANNQGVSVARNVGIENSKGDFIAFLDADDEWRNDKLQKCDLWLRNNGDISLLCSSGIWRSAKDSMIVENHKLYNSTKFWRTDFNRLFSKNFLSTSGVVVRKSTLIQYGMFDVGLRTLQDYDMWLKIIKNIKFAILPDLLYIYNQREFSISTNYRRRLKFRLKLLLLHCKEIDYKFIFFVPLFFHHLSHILLNAGLDFWRGKKFCSSVLYFFLGFLCYPIRFDIYRRLRRLVILRR